VSACCGQRSVSRPNFFSLRDDYLLPTDDTSKRRWCELRSTKRAGFKKYTRDKCARTLRTEMGRVFRCMQTSSGNPILLLSMRFRPLPLPWTHLIAYVKSFCSFRCVIYSTDKRVYASYIGLHRSNSRHYSPIRNLQNLLNISQYRSIHLKLYSWKLSEYQWCFVQFFTPENFTAIKIKILISVLHCMYAKMQRKCSENAPNKESN